MFAAELRLPPDTNKEDRERVVAQVLEELEMTQHMDTQSTSCPAVSASAHPSRWSC